MKRCPSCNRTFLDENLSYCTDDGTPLVDQAQSSSFDPQATMLDPTPPATREIRDPQPTRPFRSDDLQGGWPQEQQQPHSWSQPSSPSAPVQPSWNTPSTPVQSQWNAPSTPVQSQWNAPSTPPSAWTPPPPPGGQYSIKKSQQNPIAVASLALGVFSLTIGLCCYLGLGAGPIAIVLGVIAMTQMKNSPTESAGKGMAIAGIATGAVAVGLNLLFIILGIAMSSIR